ncbi:beta-glucoside operon transcriptional antiterminator [Enterococcus sp. AZ194]|uniref:BglG family transcription antiterminator LicT n=1 Tax=Enterococcus sp. AZ194 TaxID=2774629 RepID=UPI003F1EF469
MEIKRVLNNNAAITLDQSGAEIIVLGKGIAFQKKKGDLMEEQMVEKIFHLSNSDVFLKFQELLTEIPLEYMNLSDEIITMAKSELGKKLNDSIYVSLSDHLYNSVKRFKEGIMMKNALLWDIRRFYPVEYRLAVNALEMIQKTLDLRLPEDEAGFIALHFVNAEDVEANQDSYQVTKIMQEISNIVRYYFKIEFDEESLYFYRFITHLKFFAQRLTSNKLHSDKHEEDLVDVVKVRFQSAYACVEKVSEHIERNYQYVLTDEEKLYLTIHIHRVVYKD